MTTPTEHHLKSGDHIEIMQGTERLAIVVNDPDAGTTTTAWLTPAEAMTIGGDMWGRGLRLRVAKLGRPLTPEDVEGS